MCVCVCVSLQKEGGTRLQYVQFISALQHVSSRKQESLDSILYKVRMCVCVCVCVCAHACVCMSHLGSFSYACVSNAFILAGS